jgi:hypothetical protein
VRRAAAALLLAAACGGPSAGPDSGAADASGDPDAARAAGTWDDPVAIAPLPFLHRGDTAGAAALAASYDCAPASDESGGEVVFRLEVAAPTTYRFGLDDRGGDAIDVDLQIAASPPDAAGAVAGCAARADLAIETELDAGSWFVVADTYTDLAGPFTLSVVHADPGACLVNPLPECGAGDTPDVNGVPVEPPGLGGCPPGMIAIDGFCIDRWESALVLGGAGWSPYANPGTAEVRAVSAPGVVPQGYISGTQAGAACARAGKRLCSDAEWLRACQGAAGHTFPYGDARVDGACNDARACHPAVQYFESSDGSVFSMIDHPCIGQLPDGLAPTGAYAACASDEGVHDLMGNLHEWTADPAGTFRGGFYVDTAINGAGCLYRTTAHDTGHWDYSTGFRCCADL